MKHWFKRARYYGLVFGLGGMFFLGGCGLNDQQLAQIWQAVVTAGLNTVVGNAINAAIPPATTTG